MDRKNEIKTPDTLTNRSKVVHKVLQKKGLIMNSITGQSGSLGMDEAWTKRSIDISDKYPGNQ
jgi:hypothetical protein